MALGWDEQLLQDVINVCCSVRNDMYELFCTRTPEQLASMSVYEQIGSNCLLLHKCKGYLEQSNVPGGLAHIHILSLHMMLCNILLLSAISLCETYRLATAKFIQTRDRVGYKRALFTHQGNLYHADIDYHCSCHVQEKLDRQSAILTSTFLDRCAVAVSNAYNVHSYVDISTQERHEPNTLPLTDLINRMMQATGVLYSPLVLPPDVLGSTKPAASCRLCSRDAVIRGTMALSESEAVCTCTVSIYTGTNIDGGRHSDHVSARRLVLDTTQRSMCMQRPLCDCTIHRKAFASTLRQLTSSLTGNLLTK